MIDVENPMVIDSIWRKHECEPKVIGECAGCQEDIYEGQYIYDFDGELVHQNPECCMNYVANMSVCKIAGE